MRLDIDMLGPKQLLGSLDGKQFNLIDILAPAVVPATRLAFRIFVCENRPRRFEYGRRRIIFGSDQFQTIMLANLFSADGIPQRGIIRLLC